MKFAKLISAGAIVLLPGLLPVMALAQDPIEAAAEDSRQQDTAKINMLDALYFEGNVTLDINFETGKAAVREASWPIIDEVVQIMNVNPGLKLNVECYTDELGDPKSNQALSENRAEELKAAIVTRGIDVSRLGANGHGQDKPATGNDTEAGRAGNSRVELVVQSALPSDAAPIVQAEEHFGVRVYPGAKFDEGQTKFSRNILGLDLFCYLTQDDLKKVNAFYEKLSGFVSLGAGETSAMFMKTDENGSSVRIALASPWFDPRTGKSHSNTMIQILKAE